VEERSSPAISSPVRLISSDATASSIRAVLLAPASGATTTGSRGAVLVAAGIDHDASPVLDDAVPERYAHLLFVCGPVQGQTMRERHDRLVNGRRIAVNARTARERLLVGDWSRFAPRERPEYDDRSLNAPAASIVCSSVGGSTSADVWRRSVVVPRPTTGAGSGSYVGVHESGIPRE
jgi:hypothetical protein